MKSAFLKARLTAFLLGHHLRALLARRVPPATLVRSLQKQLVVSSLFRDAKYSQVGDKVFIDPFAPYFPSPYCTKLFNHNTDGAYPPKPNFAQLSITTLCPCQCVHCHVKNTQGPELPADLLLRTIGEIAEADFPLIFFVGGEPMSRFADLLEFITAARRYMDTRIFTSGVGVNPSRLQRLKQAGLEGICVSLDHHEERIHNAKRNHPAAFRAACETIRAASAMGFYVSVVCCTTRPMVASGDTFKVVDLAESLGAHSIQLNEIRPVGRALESAGYDFYLTDGEKQTLIDYYRRSNRSRRSIAIVMPWFNEEPDKFGCTATAGQQAYIDAQGNLQPCPLLKVGFGNIRERSFRDIWEAFRSQCRHPIRECVVHRVADELRQSAVLPLPVKRAYELWPEMCRLEATEVFNRLRSIDGAEERG